MTGSQNKAANLLLIALLSAPAAVPGIAFASAVQQDATQTTDNHGVPVESSDQMKADQHALKADKKQSKRQAKADRKAAKEKGKAAKQAAKAEQHQDKADQHLNQGGVPPQ